MARSHPSEDVPATELYEEHTQHSAIADFSSNTAIESARSPTKKNDPAVTSVPEVLRQSAIADFNCNSSDPRLDDLAAGLGRLGFGVKDSKRIVYEAAQSLAASDRTEVAVPRRALGSAPRRGLSRSG